MFFMTKLQKTNESYACRDIYEVNEKLSFLLTRSEHCVEAYKSDIEFFLHTFITWYMLKMNNNFYVTQWMRYALIKLSSSIQKKVQFSTSRATTKKYLQGMNEP